MKLLTPLALLILCLSASAQTFLTKSKTQQAPSISPLTFYPGTYINNESRYVDGNGINVIIQNSRRKAGASLDDTGEKGYHHPSGKRFSLTVYWTRIINETDTALNLSIQLPADSFPLLSSPGAYVKLFVPPDTMTLEKEALFNYGLTGLKSFLDTDFDQPSNLRRTINSKEVCQFYVLVLLHQEQGNEQAGFVMKGKDLFYQLSIAGQLESTLIPCGQIVF